MSFDEQVKLAVWNKASFVFGKDPLLFRLDQNGLEIHWLDYGNRQSAFGWEIHHVKPIALGGTDAFDNLVPLHWETNARLGGLFANR